MMQEGKKKVKIYYHDGNLWILYFCSCSLVAYIANNMDPTAHLVVEDSSLIKVHSVGVYYKVICSAF